MTKANDRNTNAELSDALFLNRGGQFRHKISGLQYFGFIVENLLMFLAETVDRLIKSIGRENPDCPGAFQHLLAATVLVLTCSCRLALSE